MTRWAPLRAHGFFVYPHASKLLHSIKICIIIIFGLIHFKLCIRRDGCTRRTLSKEKKMYDEELYDIVESDPIAIVVRCPDRRFREAHKGVITGRLGLKPEDYEPLKPAGGATILALSEILPAPFKALIDDIAMFVEGHPSIRHIILIAHEDCKKVGKHLPPSRREQHAERRLLVMALRLMEHTYPDLDIGAYYAHFVETPQGRKIRVETVKASALQKTDSPQLVGAA